MNSRQLLPPQGLDSRCATTILRWAEMSLKETKTGQGTCAHCLGTQKEASAGRRKGF
jgi:hypothetical protein